MQVAFCENCGKYTGHKRALGMGTALGALVTGGASLLAVPCYGLRCVICGLTVEQAQALKPQPIRYCTGCGKPVSTAFCTGCGTARK